MKSLLLCLRHAKTLTEEKELRTHTLAIYGFADGLWLFCLLLLRWTDSALNRTVVCALLTAVSWL